MTTTPTSEEVPPHADAERGAKRVGRHVPRLLQQHLADDPGSPWWTHEGTSAFVDVSGFTNLSEQLARKGREGAEQITEVIGQCFDSILQVAYEGGGSLLKFGGDALLLWFDGPGHVERCAHATLRMRAILDVVGRISLPDAEVVLQMSQGVHSGEFHFFAAGTSHTELIPTGPAWSRLVMMEHTASAGEILLSPETAAQLPEECIGDAKDPGRLLKSAPGEAIKLPLVARPTLPPSVLSHCLPPLVRNYLMAGGGASEHRPVSIAFLRFEGIDRLIAERGGEAAAAALKELVSVVEAATEAQDVALLGSDVDVDGGKLILTAGAPKVTGDDEERLLLAVRRILDTSLPLPVRIGVNRGGVFAGNIGPSYRKTYTVMGDAVNLTARLMAKAEPGHAYAAESILERSNTLFDNTEIEPFVVKGKAEPVHAWSLGKAKGSRAQLVTLQRLALTGRNNELGIIRKILGGMRSGAGHLVAITGHSGVGKSRLLEATRDAAIGFKKLHNTCEAYTSSMPYAVWRDLLRELLEISRDTADAEVEARVRALVAEKVPDIGPWLPLLAAAFGLAVDATPDVEMLTDKNRRTRLHEVVARFLEVTLPGPAFVEIENAHHMDEASAELLGALVNALPTHRWLFGVARRPGPAGFKAPDGENVTKLELNPLAMADAMRLAELATKDNPLHAHVLEVIAQRSGGNPQFLRDLLRFAIQSGGIVGLPESAEAAALARIDALAPEDRAVVRRAALFGLTFHPRMLAWFDGDDDPPPPPEATWARLSDLFDDDGEGYYRFRQSLLRDTAYEGLPFKLRRRLHSIVAVHVEEEADDPDDVAGILAVHYGAAGDHASAWRYGNVAGQRAQMAYAFVEAAGLYARALEAGRQVKDIPPIDIARTQEAMADSWSRTGEYRKASDGYVAARELFVGDRLSEARLLLKLSQMEERLGRYPEALRWVERAHEALEGVTGLAADQQHAAASARHATVLQVEGRTREALEWAERAAKEADAVDDPEALGAAYFIIGTARSRLGEQGGEEALLKSLEAYKRSGNRVRQAMIFNNLGVSCQWEGRWDEAMTHYERGREESLKIGNLVAAAIARLNMAEILMDRGEVEEAGLQVRETLPLWSSSQYRFFHGVATGVLGLIALRSSKLDAATQLLDEARSSLADVGAKKEVLDFGAGIAECRLLQHDPDGALALADEILASTEADDAVAKLTPRLQRVRGFAMLMQADPFGAREAFEQSLAAARARNEHFDIALTLNAIGELDRLEGVEPPQEQVEEIRAITARLKIRALPPIPQFG